MTKIRISSLLLGAFLILAVFTSMAYGVDDEDTREYMFVQGVVSKYNGDSFLVNEGLKVYLTHKTKIFDERGRPAANLKPALSKWVYVEGPLNEDGSINAESLYLLRGHIGKKDRSKYPFMQIP